MYVYYTKKTGEITVSDQCGYDLFGTYNGWKYDYLSSAEAKEYNETDILPSRIYETFDVKGDKHLTKAKNKEVSKKHYIVRDTHHGLIGDNYTDLEEAKEAAAKQFKSKRSVSATTSRDIVVYESILCIKEPVPAVDWITID